MTHRVLDYLVLVSAIRYRDQDNQWRELPFEGAYCTKDGRFYNRDGSKPHLPIKGPVVAFGSKGRCPCCGNWLDLTPCTESPTRMDQYSTFPTLPPDARFAKQPASSPARPALSIDPLASVSKTTCDEPFTITISVL